MSPFMSELLLPTCSWTAPPESCQGRCTICRLAWSESQLSWHPPAREEGEREICALRFLWCLCWNDCITHVIPCTCTVCIKTMSCTCVKQVKGLNQFMALVNHNLYCSTQQLKPWVELRKLWMVGTHAYTCTYMHVHAAFPYNQPILILGGGNQLPA